MSVLEDLSFASIGVVQFPGSNCDMDCKESLKRHFNVDAKMIWHGDGEPLPKLDGLVIPGGFSFGDYLRSGALASHAPVMNKIKAYADRGGAIIGICNGFQILTESRLLPGALLHNNSRKFICKNVTLKTSPGSSSYQNTLKDELLNIPIAHGEGRYYIDNDGLKKLQDNEQIVFQYSDEAGNVAHEANPNGSSANIAGVCSPSGRILGMMPHPERATDSIHDSIDGLKIWQSFFKSFL